MDDTRYTIGVDFGTESARAVLVDVADGRELGVKDVVASLQRIFKVSSPTSGTFFAIFVGADKCLKDPANCTLEGGVVRRKRAAA